MKNSINILILLLSIASILFANDTLATAKDEIMATEISFAQRVADKGLKEAFLYYAAENAVLSRGEKLFRGKAEIANYFDNNSLVFKSFNWLPDYIEVSKSNDLAYTFGQYQIEYYDKAGILQNQTGVFHTVWKKQINGEWRFVWD